MTAREAALIAWSAFLCVSASFLRSACVRPPPPPSAQKMQYRSVGDLALAQKTCWREMHGRYREIEGRYVGDRLGAGAIDVLVGDTGDTEQIHRRYREIEGRYRGSASEMHLVVVVARGAAHPLDLCEGTPLRLVQLRGLAC